MKIKFVDSIIKVNRRILFENVNLEIMPGFIYRIEGLDGVGKTVLMNSLLGLNEDVNGTVEIEFNKDRLTYIPDMPCFLDNDRISDILRTFSFFYKTDVQTIGRCLEKLGMDLNIIKPMKIFELSYDMRKKIHILPLFLESLDQFFLDEIFSGLDENTQTLVLKRLVELGNTGKGVVIIEHNNNIVEELMKRIKVRRLICKNQKILTS